jgi:hypothetical protein
MFAECAGHLAAEPAKGKARKAKLSRFGDSGKDSSRLPAKPCAFSQFNNAF